MEVCGGRKLMSRCASKSALKQQLQSELDVSWVLRGQDGAQGRRADEDVGKVKIRPVQEIERFGPELERHPLAQSRVFDQGDIDGLERRPVENVASGISKASEGGDYERRGVEPEVWCAVGEV